MDESVHLPNEVSCSNQRLNGPPILGQNKRITAEYKRVNATSTRRSRSSTIEPVGTGNIDNVTAGAKTVAENGTTLKILKLVCIGLSVSTIISTATFGGMIHNLTKRIENNEREYETVQSDIARLHVLADRETPMSTDGNDKSSINTSISEFQQLKYRLDILESVTENHGSAISHLEILEHSITLTNENLISHGIILAALNDSVMQLKALSIELSNSSKTGGTKLSQLEADINSFDAIIQELASGTNDFDANRTADLPLNVRLMTVISNMEANLTLATQMIKTQGDTIQAINETVVHMGTVTSKANSSSVVDAEILLADLEEKIESRLLQIELDVEMGKSENLSSNLIDLKLEIGILKIENQDHHDRLDMQIGTINEAIQNNDAGINDNSDKIRLLNETITANVGNAQNFESNITDLERDIGTVKAAIQNNYNEIASSFEDIEELNKSTSDSLSQLATRLTEGTAQTVKSSYAFSAYTLTDTSLTKGKTLVFSKILNDEEQTYDNSSGQYTVPVSGTYLFTATLCVSANTDGRLNFVADGIRFGALFVGDSKWTVCSQGTAIGRLYKGAKVWLTADTIGTAYDRVNNPLGFNYFAGYMINETRD